MKQSLNLKLSQGLKLTPQLKQSIKILQLSAVELQSEVQDMLDNNPLLEEEFPKSEKTEVDLEKIAQQETEQQTRENEWQEQFETRQTLNNSNNLSEASDIFATTAAQTSLKDELLWQLQMLPLSDTDHKIAETIIYSLNSSGYLKLVSEDILTILQTEIETIDQEEIDAIIKLIQSFEPIGVAAKDLQHRLEIIFNHIEINDPEIIDDNTHLIAKKIVVHHLADLASKNIPALKTHLDIDQETLIQAIEYIQNLNPNIEDRFDKDENIYIIPDIIVKSVNNEWRVEINPQIRKKVRLNDTYTSIPKEQLDQQASQYISDALFEAKGFIKSLNSRYDTLKRVASAIVANQVEFFKQGDVALKPMVLQQIAEQLDLHESTISRATSNKYMLTPLGVFELKYFFSTGLSSSSGDEVSSTTIRTIIKKLIDDEEKRKPISDNKITLALEQQGFQVARRTVAKYREAMNIPASSKRKSII